MSGPTADDAARAATPRRVEIIESGRYGQVVYHEGAHSLAFYWEFGGSVVAIIQVSDTRAWQDPASWFAGRRMEILRFVAYEVIRQRAPTCRAEIDEQRGEIVLHQGSSQTTAPGSIADTPQTKAYTFVRRYSKLKAMLGLGLLVAMLIFGAVMWLGKKVLTVGSAKGVPLAECVRTDAHIASLLQSTDPHLPEISGRGGNETTSISILLIPLDGSKPHVVQVAEGLKPNEYALAKILGSDGKVLWFDVHGTGGVDLESYELLEPGEVRDPQVPKSNWPFAIDPTSFLSAGFIAAPGQWLGLHSAEEIQGEFAPGKFLRHVVSQESLKRLRRFHRGTLEPPVDDKYHRILSMEALDSTGYFNAAFLRMDDASEPLRLSDPDGALMIHTSEPGLKGTLIVSRVDLEGKVIWSVDTAIDRFKLSQILPGEKSFAFVGTRLPIPDKLSEPIVVVLDNVTGKGTTHSLWR